jgi:hypothetical protein
MLKVNGEYRWTIGSVVLAPPCLLEDKAMHRVGMGGAATFQ